MLEQYLQTDIPPVLFRRYNFIYLLMHMLVANGKSL
jgi:hypothetical protein